MGGHLAVLQFARANGCEWDYWTCAEAAAGGHLAVLKYAVANGCFCDLQECLGLAPAGNAGMSAWLHEQIAAFPLGENH